MSKWRKALKNNRRFDARYFLNERVENEEIVENSTQQEEVKRNFNDFSLDSWLTEAEEAIDEAHCTSKRDDDLEEDAEYGEPMEESGDKQATLAQLKKELEGLHREYRQAQFGSWEQANISQAMSRVKDKIKQLGKSDIEELVVPGVMPKGGGDADGMSPAQIRMAKAEAEAKAKKSPAQIRMAKAKAKAKKSRENAKKKGLGPVPDNLKPEKNEG